MMMKPRHRPVDLAPAELVHIVLSIQEMLWRVDDGIEERWDADKPWEGTESLPEIASLLEGYGLKPVDLPEDDPADQPDEGDLVTEDYVHFFRIGESFTAFHRLDRPDIVVEDDKDWREAVRRFMDEQGFWPSIWHLSDHGNLTLLGLGDEA
jgi:hypothetical protein